MTVKAQYAIMCKGNVNAKFLGCEFNGYMHEQGAAIRLFYADYSAIPYVINEYGDNATCQADIVFNNCLFKNNASLYGGGAIYAEGNNKNIKLTIQNCDFKNNISGAGDYSYGGGAICVSDVNLFIENSNFDSNIGNYLYEGIEMYDPDSSKGGAIFCNLKCNISITESNFTKNQASLGGAISLLASTGEIKGGIFDSNVAKPIISPEIKSLTSCGGVGGAMSFNNPENVLILNSDITNNSAENAYGFIYTDYSKTLEQIGLGARKVDILFCTIADNKVNTKETEFYKYGETDYEWKYYPSNFYNIPYVNTKCSICIDETIKEDSYKTPTKENNYCYFASIIKAEEDNYTRTYNKNNEHVKFDKAIIVPVEYINQLNLNTKNELKKGLIIGSSNDAKKIYLVETPKVLPIYAICLIVIFACLLIACIVLIIIKKYKNKKINNEVKVVENNEEVVIEKKQLNESDIEIILNNPKLDCLSAREKEVLAVVLAGKKRKEIAEILFVTESTVKKHISSIYDKLNVKHEKLYIRNNSINSFFYSFL